MEDNTVEEITAVLKPGQRVYDERDDEIGVIQGMTDTEIEISVNAGIETAAIDRVTGTEFGDIDERRSTCPNCGGPREDLYFYLEDYFPAEE